MVKKAAMSIPTQLRIKLYKSTILRLNIYLAESKRAGFLMNQKLKKTIYDSCHWLHVLLQILISPHDVCIMFFVTDSGKL